MIAAQRLARAARRPASPPRSSTAPSRAGSTGSRARASHGAGHKLCSDGFYQALGELSARTACALPTCEASGHRCEMGRDGAGGDGGVLLGRAPAACAGGRGRPARPPRPWRRGSTALAPAARRPRRKPRAGAPARRGRVRAGVRRRPRSRPSSRSRPGSVDDTARRARPGAPALQQGLRRARCSSPPPTCWARRPSAPSRPASARATGTRHEPGVAHALGRRHLRGRHGRDPLGHLELRPPRRRRVVLRGLPRAARPHRRAAARHRGQAPGAARPVLAVRPGLRPRGPQDRRGRADPRRPQALQLLQENFPRGTVDHADAVGPGRDLAAPGRGARDGGRRSIAPFVTRPNETVAGPRARSAWPRPTPRRTGVYLLREPDAARATAHRAAGERRRLRLRRAGAAAARAGRHRPAGLLRGERRAVRPAARRGAEAHLPRGHAREAMGITGFTLPTMYRWIRSDLGRAHTLHPFAKGHFLGSGPGPRCSPRRASTARARRRRSGATSRRGPRPQSGTCSTMS